jgi:hypothetical protein
VRQGDRDRQVPGEGANAGLPEAESLVRHQPVPTASTRVSRFASLPVCEQCAGKVEGNSGGTRSEGSPPILHLPNRTSNNAFGSGTHHAHKTQSKGEPAQDSGSNGADQLQPIRMVTSAREHDFSGYRQTGAGANRLKKALNRCKLNPGPSGVFQDRPVLGGVTHVG